MRRRKTNFNCGWKRINCKERSRKAYLCFGWFGSDRQNHIAETAFMMLRMQVISGNAMNLFFVVNGVDLNYN